MILFNDCSHAVLYKMATSVGANLLLSVDIPQYNITVQKEHQQRWRVKFMP